MSTTIVSQSIGIEYSKQGVEISSYDDVFNTLVPRLLSNSSPKTVINGRVRGIENPFDESNSFIISNSKKKNIPNHEAERRDFGKAKLFRDDTPFEDFSNSTPTSYILMQGDQSTGCEYLDLIYPYVLDLPGQMDPGNEDGVIEPFVIRSWTTRKSTDRPHSSRRVRGAISDFHEDQFGFCIPIEQKILLSSYDSGIRPYMEYGDDANRPMEQKSGYFADDPNDESPFIEKTKEEEFANIVGEEFARALAGSTTAFDEVGKTYISAAAGYTFIDSQNGTDSIAFLDQKGI